MCICLVLRRLNAAYFYKWLELLCTNSGRFEVNQLLSTGDTALVANSEEQLRWLVSEFDRA